MRSEIKVMSLKEEKKQHNLEHFLDRLWFSASDQLTTDDVKRKYAEWAATYDQYMQEPNLQLIIPLAQCFDTEVTKLSRSIDKDDFKILDIAAGTGLLGIELNKHGFLNIDALDMSQKMLDQANGKNIYRKFICSTLTDQPTPNIETGEYDAVTCAAALGVGHVGPSAFKEMIRVTKPGGLLCFSIRFMEYSNYKAKLLELEEAREWKLARQEMIPFKMNEYVEEIYLLVYERT